MDHPTKHRKSVSLQPEPRPQSRLYLLRDEFARQMEQDVLAGLTTNGQKQLPSIYFYDEAGSRLYEKITQTTDYYPTRHEAGLLRQVQSQLSAWIRPVEIVELGSGSSTKTPLVLNAFEDVGYLTRYVAIDIDPSVLETSLESLRGQYPTLDFVGLAGRFEETLASLTPTQERLYLFLGSTLGNFSPAYQQVFFENLLNVMAPGDSLMVGFDLRPGREKPIDVVEQAYNDRDGVTAEFNLNMLRHINTVLGTRFDLDQWQHQAFYNTERHQIEMHLKSLTVQTVSSPLMGNAFRFEAGETILTELSRKFNPQELADWFETLGFSRLTIWTDPKKYVGLLLLQKP